MKKKYAILTVFGVILVSFCVFQTFEGVKKLSGINYALFDIDSNVALCYYEDRYGGPVVVDFVKQVFWNDKYIIVQRDYDVNDKYYIVELLKTDTSVVVTQDKQIQRNYQQEELWKTEGYEHYDTFSNRLKELDIDTLKMHHYSWKAWVGIY